MNKMNECFILKEDLLVKAYIYLCKIKSNKQIITHEKFQIIAY